jgi:hypothetical protein
MKITKEKLKQIVREELQSLSENSNYYFLMDPQGMRGKDGFYKRLATNDDSQFEFGHIYSATGWKNKAEAQRTLKRVKNSSSKYRNANLKVVRGDEVDESMAENQFENNAALSKAIANRDADHKAGKNFKNDVGEAVRKAISKNAKNNKLKGYSAEVANYVTDILLAVEEDRLAIGDVFNGLKGINKKIKK